MIFAALVAAGLAALSAVPSASASTCSSPLTRVEWSTLSSNQKSQYVNAMLVLANRAQSAKGVLSDPSVISLKDFTNLYVPWLLAMSSSTDRSLLHHSHARASPWAHGSAEFYPYHRAMVWKFEQAMQTAGWSGGVVYWDWPAVYNSWWNSDLVSSSYLGSCVSVGTNNCVNSGVFSSSAYSVAVLDSDVTAYADGMHATSATQCLQRCATQSAVTNPSDINTRYSATTYAAFRGDAADGNDDESGFHASGHETFGGTQCQSDMANASISPNDPLFWMHHVFVDKVWWRWQSRCESFKFDYEGPLTANDPIDLAGTDTATMTEDVDTWGVTVGELLDTEGSLLCYTYSSSGSDLTMPSVTCPTFTGIPAAADEGTNSATTATADSGVVVTVTDAQGSVVTTISAAPAATTTAAVTLNDVWLNKLFVALVAVKSVSFNVATTSAASSSSSVAVFGRRDFGRRDSSHYDIDYAANGTILITFNQVNKTVTIPANQTLRYVYRSYAEAYNEGGKIIRYYIDTPLVPYVPIDGAPDPASVGPDHPCYQMYPNPMSDRWIAMHQLNKNKIRNSEARRRERIDKWNVDNCGGNSTTIATTADA
ncbi:hypothetical protein HDU83_000127 [Entophlyctis luteolus]|nr:hypothetical protein HDU82_001508 [Entophlyctis luteolus]KAJ3356711.1 hypothetical protein HDU83_000127 [Entophlyctis luteolus]